MPKLIQSFVIRYSVRLHGRLFLVKHGVTYKQSCNIKLSMNLINNLHPSLCIAVALGSIKGNLLKSVLTCV